MNKEPILTAGLLAGLDGGWRDLWGFWRLGLEERLEEDWRGMVAGLCV